LKIAAWARGRRLRGQINPSFSYFLEILCIIVIEAKRKTNVVEPGKIEETCGKPAEKSKARINSKN
jgi:hypothetical protein